MGRLRRRLCQFAPSLVEYHTPRSVPATSNPRLLGSSRTTRVNSLASMPLSMRVQVVPQFVVFQRYGRLSSSWKRLPATYAIHSPKRDASTLDTRVNFTMSFGVTSSHFTPPSRVKNTLP